MSGLRVESKGAVMILTIDRPKANAIDSATSRAMGEAFEMFRDDPESRVAVVTGAGERFFSAGWDLKAAAEGEEYEADYGVGGFGGFPELPNLNKPVIAAVNGLAVGGGFELTLAADLVVAAEHSEFFFGELAVGVIPDAGTVRLPRVVPPAIAKELILTGRRLSAIEARDIGLVNEVVDASELMTTATRLADKIAAMAPLAVEATLAVMRETSGLPIRDAFRALRDGRVDAYSRMVDSEDAKEGPAAFSEGRRPNWEGR